MNVDMTDEYPFLETEREYVARRSGAGVPYPALGGQMLARALEHPVYSAGVREIGFNALHPTPDAADDPLMSVFDDGDVVFHWHEDTFDLPRTARARDRRCRADPGVPLRRDRVGHAVPPRGGPGGDRPVAEDRRRRGRRAWGSTREELEARPTASSTATRTERRRAFRRFWGVVRQADGHLPLRLARPAQRVYDRRTISTQGRHVGLNVVSFRPERSDYAWTFGGVEPVMKVKPGDVLEVWTDDCFAGLVESVDDLPSKKITGVQPADGPVLRRGRGPGDTLALHFVSIELVATGPSRRPSRCSARSPRRPGP